MSTFIISLLENFFIWLYLALHLNVFGEIVFLHYTVHFGVDLVGGRGQIFALPFLGLALIILNFTAAYLVYEKMKRFSFMLTGCAVILQAFLIAKAFFLVFINH